MRKSLLVKALKRRGGFIVHARWTRTAVVHRGAQAACTLTPTIISEANSLYRAVRRPNRILDNAIIRTAYKLDACVPTPASLQALRWRPLTGSKPSAIVCPGTVAVYRPPDAGNRRRSRPRPHRRPLRRFRGYFVVSPSSAALSVFRPLLTT